MPLIAIETNIFAIQNLERLTAKYRLYRVKGLRSDQAEYYQNAQYLTKRLSYTLKSPILSIQRGDDTFLVVRDGVQNLPEVYALVRQRVRLELASDTLHLDFTNRSAENDAICVRFLQFALQEALFQHPTLWQPASGRPFFEYRPHRIDGNICHYRGFSVRVTPIPSSGLGVAVDVTAKSVSRLPLPARLARDTFSQWRSKNVIYHYGHQWYEIQVAALDDRSCGEYEIEDQGKWVSLLDFATRKSRKPIPKELADVTPDDSVILYRNNQNQDRAAIARLCYPVFGTDSSDTAANLHRESILPPDARREAIQTFAQTYLPLLRFGGAPLSTSLTPEAADVRMFNIPDQRFGQGKVLSTIGTPGTTQVSLDQVGSARKAFLHDSTAGFFSRSSLDRQHLILPASVAQSYGPTFLKDLAREVEHYYPHGGKYQPRVIPYDDRGKHTFTVQGAAILQAIEKSGIEPGYALVMVHHTVDRQARQEDQLAGMLTRELRERFDVTAAAIHSRVPGASYMERRTPDGKREYSVNPKSRGKFAGYVRNVALNKVLLTNQKWPFVLDKRLHADITIGVDVKQNTAGVVVVSNRGQDIRTLTQNSRQKERLMDDQMRDYLIEVVTKEAGTQSDLIQTIVIHRDGRSHQSELIGAAKALECLRKDGIIHPDATLTVLDIPKSAPVHLRLFAVTTDDEHDHVANPQVGCYYIINEMSAYLCSTGRAFQHDGTTRPLAVRRVYGSLGMHECLEDLYALTTLAWSKPDDCSRYPITLKLCDRYLTEDATAYDQDALTRAEALAELEVSSDDE